MSVILTRHKLSVADYERMITSGILAEDDRVELIRGEIIDKMTPGNRHVSCVNRLTRLLVTALGNRGTVSVQNPVLMSDSAPEPDLSVLRPRDDDYASGKPQAADVLLVVEVADSSVDIDRETKLNLYAENGLGEYWLVNLIDDQIEVFRQPLRDGTYAEPQIAQRGDHIEPLAFAGIRLAVSDILP